MDIVEQNSSRLTHAMTVDVEDWYHDGFRDRPLWGSARVERNTMALLDLFADTGSRATLFFLGEVAEEHPHLLRRAVAEGHEVASHGYRHRSVASLTRNEFRLDVLKSIAVIEDTAGCRVRGYRAPYFSIKADVRWPIEILQECGLDYDASVLAIDRPPGLELVSPRSPYKHPSGLLELPVALLKLGPFWHLPLWSGAGLRMLPGRMLSRSLSRFEKEVGAGVFYLHPWEIDSESPVRPGFGGKFLRVGRSSLLKKLHSWCREISFVSLDRLFLQAERPRPVSK